MPTTTRLSATLVLHRNLSRATQFLFNPHFFSTVSCFIYTAYAVTFHIDKTKSALNTFAILQLTTEKVFRFIDNSSIFGALDLYIYFIDDDCRDDPPFYVSIPGIIQHPFFKKHSIGDESYQSYVEKTLKQFKKDSAIQSIKLEVIKTQIHDEFPTLRLSK